MAQLVEAGAKRGEGGVMKNAVRVQVHTESVMSRDAYKQWLRRIKDVWPEVACMELEEKQATTFSSQDEERATTTHVQVIFGGTEKQ